MEVLVSQLEREAHQLEQDGDDIRAIRMMERALAQRIAARMNGSIPAAERLIVKYNTVAVRCFKNDDFEAAQTLLNSALELTSEGSVVFLENDQSRIKLRGTTLNNFGCLERRRGNMTLAAAYLKQSIEHAGQDSPASFLNLSAVLTNLGRYTDAVAWCRRAIAMLENEQHQNMISSSNDDQQQQQVAQKKSDAPGLMAIAYHNLASPLEQLDRAAAIAAYRKALEIARTEIGVNSSTTRSIQMSLDRFLKMTPAQVTAAGSPSQQLAQQQQLALASGDLKAAAKVGSAVSALPTPGSSFLPQLSTNNNNNASTLHPQNNTPRARAAALAAARRKPDYLSNATNVGGKSYASRGPTPTAQQQQQVRASPRKLSPMEGRRRVGGSSDSPPGSAERKRRTVATPPKFMTERQPRKSDIRERTAAKLEEERSSRSVREPMAKSQDRTHSRTPPPKTSSRHNNNDDDNHNQQRYNSREETEPRRQNNNNKNFSNTARVESKSRRPTSADQDQGKPPRPRSSEKVSKRNEESDQQQQQQFKPKPPTDRKASTAAASTRKDSNAATAAASTRDKDNNSKNTDRKNSRATATRDSERSTKNEKRDEGRQFSRAIAPGSGSGNPVKDLEEEISKKDDIVSFMVARLAALLRAEEDFERCYIAVCRIQCLFRRVRAKTRVADLRKHRELAVTYRQVRENCAARCVMRFFRKLVARRQETILMELRQQEIQAIHDLMASKLQRMARMWLAKRDLSRRRADARLHARALRVLQCWFRKLLAQRLADRLRATKSSAEQNKLYVERREFAASQIQRIFLGRRDALKIHRIRRSMRMLREKEMESRRTSSAKRIQAAWRGFIGRRIARGKRLAADTLRAKIRRWELVQRCTRLLQAWTRGTLCRLRCAPELTIFRQNQQRHRDAYKNNAATKINSVVRGFLARRLITRAIQARAAQRKLDWFQFLMPNLQAYVRARLSIVKTSKKLFRVRVEEARALNAQAKQRQEFEDAFEADCVNQVYQPEVDARKSILRDCEKDWQRVHALDLQEAEAYEARMRAAAEAAERKRIEDMELATAGPVNGERRRPGKVSNELKVGSERLVPEIDEEDKDAKRIFEAQRVRQMQKEERERNERQQMTPSRGPFYSNDDDVVEQEFDENGNEITPRSKKNRSQLAIFNVTNPHRNLSVPVRESLRKQELNKRTQDRLAALKAEEEERKRVLAAASGIRLAANDAVSRASKVVEEPMPEVEKTHVVEEYEKLKQQEEQERQNNNNNNNNNNNDHESSPIGARNKVSKQTVSSPEVRQHAWEDFSRLDQFTTAHRDQVLNAIIRKSVSLVQACLRSFSSAKLVDLKAATYLGKLPEMKQNAGVISSYLNSVVSAEELRRKERLTELRLKEEAHHKKTEQNSVGVIQAFARALISSANVVLMKSLASFQEKRYAATKIQTSVRYQQAKPQRLGNLKRENFSQKTNLSGATDNALEDQVRNYAALHIQHFLKSQTIRRAAGRSGSVVAQKRADKDARKAEAERSCSALTRAFAIKIIQRFVRKTLQRLKARRKRRNDLSRRGQLKAGDAFDQERFRAIRMIQAAARHFILRIRRRKAIATTSRRLYEVATQLDLERNYAALKIQSAARQKIARNKRKALELKRSQKWAGMLDQELAQQTPSQSPQRRGEDGPAIAAADENEAATKIQCAFRVGAAKKQVAELRDQKKADWERMAQEAAEDDEL